MAETSFDPKNLATFGRSFFLLFNRSTMYDANHPYCQQAIDEFLPTVLGIVKSLSPLVFIMNQDNFFVDEEPLDPRINTKKMLSHFKKAEIQSISFYEGINKRDTIAFVEIFTTPNQYPNAQAMIQELDTRGIKSIKLNHVFFKKVSTDEEIVTRDAVERISLEGAEKDEVGSKKMFLDMALESILMEEFEKTLTIKNITEHPDEVSDNMIETDLKTYHQSDAADKEPGLVLAHQLQVMQDEVARHLGNLGGGAGTGGSTSDGVGPAGSGKGPGDSGSEGPGDGFGNGSGTGEGPGGTGSADMSALAEAVFKIKRQLINGMELQKSLGVSYSNEQDVLDKADEITDNVLIQLIKDEYKSGQISTARLAQILKRLVPDAEELKRLMPKIKKALLEEGMQLSDYLKLVQDLSDALQSEELSKVLQKSAETVGIDGTELIQELRSNPEQAAELIFLAAEIKKGGGDENTLTEILVDYVEKIGSKLTLDTAKEENVQGEEHLRGVMNSVESQILGKLKNMDIKNDVLERLEEKLNSRIDELFEKVKAKYVTAPPTEEKPEKKDDQSILQILEQSVDEDEELGDILRTIRHQAQTQGFDENDFKHILENIHILKDDKQQQRERRLKLTGVLDYDGLMFFLEKEISRARRYDLPFATLSFSLVAATAKEKQISDEISREALVEAVLHRLAEELRGADVAALMEKNKLVAFLPMTPADEARLALNRHLKLLNTKPFEIDGVSITVRVAGAVTNYDEKRTPDAKAFYKALSSDLTEMVYRIKNLHGLA